MPDLSYEDSSYELLQKRAILDSKNARLLHG